MKFLILLSLFAMGQLQAQSTVRPNLPDKHDANEVPALLEERKNEDVNLSDPLDKNQVPDVMEEREEQEHWRDDYQEEQYDYNPRK